MRSLRYILPITLSIFTLLGCNNDSPITQDIITPQYQADTTNIGYLVGSVVHLRNTNLLAVEHINQAGGVLGRNFNVVILQSENPATSAAKSIELMDDFQIPLIMVTTSSRTLAVVEQAVPREVVVLTETGTSPVLTTVDDNDYLFRTAPSDVYQGRMLATLARDEGALSAAMIINEDDAYGSGLAAEFTAEFERLGGHMTALVLVPEAIKLDFGDYITQLHFDSPDTVILGLLGGSVDAQLVNESISQNFQGFYLLPDTAVGDDFTNNLASTDLIQRAMGVSPSFGVDSNPEFIHFRDAYLATFGISHQQFDPNVYDATMIAALAMEHAGYVNNTTTPNGKMIRDSMRAVMNPPGKSLGPSDISLLLEMIRNGEAVDYVGAYSTVDFDEHGDLGGTLVYDIHEYDSASGKLTVLQQLFIEVPVD